MSSLALRRNHSSFTVQNCTFSPAVFFPAFAALAFARFATSAAFRAGESFFFGAAVFFAGPAFFPAVFPTETPLTAVFDGVSPAFFAAHLFFNAATIAA